MIRKLLMAASGLFLIIFLTQHLIINATSLLPDNGNTFNTISHFMGYNTIVQFMLQPILIAGVCFHFIMGFILEISNRSKRTHGYTSSKTRGSWVSKNMILSGGVVLLFLLLHFYDFWVPELDYKYLTSNPVDSERYFEELVHKFHGNLTRTFIYCLAFIFLGLHLLHGFSSSFQTMGTGKKYLNTIVIVGKIYSYFIMFGFIIIAIVHCFN